MADQTERPAIGRAVVAALLCALQLPLLPLAIAGAAGALDAVRAQGLSHGALLGAVLFLVGILPTLGLVGVAAASARHPITAGYRSVIYAATGVDALLWCGAAVVLVAQR